MLRFCTRKPGVVFGMDYRHSRHFVGANAVVEEQEGHAVPQLLTYSVLRHLLNDSQVAGAVHAVDSLSPVVAVRHEL